MLGVQGLGCVLSFRGLGFSGLGFGVWGVGFKVHHRSLRGIPEVRPHAPIVTTRDHGTLFRVLYILFLPLLLSGYIPAIP